MESKMLHLADNLSLPLDATTETFGILARRGAGKTYAAAVLAEELIKAGAPVVILDPVGAWWGLRANADGVGAGLPVVIAGGEHGDVPLEPTGGHIIADLVVDDPRPLILDLSDFVSNAAQDRFVADFAEHLYRRKAHSRTPLHLIFDEADSFAPQRPMPGQARMLGAIEALVRRGRQRGIGATFITQRPAVLNKNVLTQIEVLIVLQLTAPQDRAAIEDWVRGHGTREQSNQLLQSLASLQRGQAWFWSPSRYDLFRQVQIRRRETFDSSRTPAVGESLIQPRQLAPVDFEKLRARLSATVGKVEDGGFAEVSRLRAELARLEKELRERPEHIVVRPVYIPIFIADEVEHLERTASNMAEVGKELVSQAEQITAILRDGQMGQSKSEELASTEDVYVRRTPTIETVAVENKQGIPSAQKKILNVLAQFPEGRTKQQVALLAKYSLRGGSFNATLSALKKEGLIQVTGNIYALTAAGQAVIGNVQPLPKGAALRKYWGNRLNTCEAAIVNVLAKSYPLSLSRSQIAQASGYEASGGSFNSALSKLRALELIKGKREFVLDEMLAD
jgi:hypothetical protein